MSPQVTRAQIIPQGSWLHQRRVLWVVPHLDFGGLEEDGEGGIVVLSCLLLFFGGVLVLVCVSSSRSCGA